jgi:hypothetical protein
MRQLEIFKTEYLKREQKSIGFMFLDLWYKGIKSDYLFNKFKDITEELKLRNVLPN